MAQIFGDYIEDLNYSQEYLVLRFSPSSISLQQRWRNNGLSADFLADYLTTFFPIGKDSGISVERQAEIKSAVSYITNELLENSMKFNDENSLLPISIQIHLDNNKIIFVITNSIHLQMVANFQNYIRKLITSDPNKLYLSQVEENMEDETTDTSGLGLLTMINDYMVHLGWKFEHAQEHPQEMTVTTMAQLDLDYSEQRKLIKISRPVEIKTDSYMIRYDPAIETIIFQGSLRLSGMEEYGLIIQLLNKVIEQELSIIIMNLRELQFLNSSGIGMLSKFVINVRKKKNIQIIVIGSKHIPWQGKSLKNLQRLMPTLKLELE